jgi:hypothetical protein
MQSPPMQMGGGLGAQGMNILMAALQRQRQGSPAAAPGGPLSLAPPAAGGGLGNALQNGPAMGLLSKLFPAQAPGQMPNAGGPGPGSERSLRSLVGT